TKFSPRAVPAVFVGYPPGMKAFKLFDIEKQEFFISRDVIFHESIFPFSKVVVSSEQIDPFSNIVLPIPFNIVVPDFSTPDPTNSHNSSSSPETVSPSSPNSNPNQQLPIPNTSEAITSQPTPNTTSDIILPTRKSTRPTKIPSYLKDYHCNLLNNTPLSTPLKTKYPLENYISYAKLSPSYRTFSLQISSHYEPQFYHQALSFAHWKDAMKAELNAMETNNTWDVVPLPSNKHTIGCKWIYKVKHRADGSIERYKTRLVAKGYTQQEGLDFIETFSPVAKLVTVRVLLTMAISFNWPLVQLDVNNAFLHGDLFEEVYMDLPLGYEPKVIDSTEKRLVCRLNKSIYGLKQASRQWFAKFSDTLITLGFTQSKADYSLFVKGTGNNFLALLVYVDDVIITGANMNLVERLKHLLNECFKLKDLGSLKFFLGLELARSSQGISISQRHYTLQLLEDTGLLGAKPESVPLDPLLKLQSSDDNLLHDPSVYRRLIGWLIYLTISRRDIMYVVNKLSQFVARPCKIHLDAAHHLLRYLKSSPEIFLTNYFFVATRF
ncbi:MAG: reverse transcriptase domain-containing protein, partial [Sweet potato little leaf phytoplasma]|nr:reverse transcriptase domain-containing protein [Sweet potato little leaf phytoplasma]